MAKPRDLLHRAGVDISRYPLHGSREGHLRWLFSAYKITHVLDIGANEGQFARSIRDVSKYTGQITSFEPAPDTFAILQAAAAADPNWAVQQCGLGSADETLELLTFAGSDWNSFHQPDDQNLAEAGRELHATGSVSCPVKRLDGIWDDIIAPGQVTFLKSDTQGHDPDVLAGAGERLSEVVGLLLEASIATFYEGEQSLIEILANAADLGFVPSGFFPVTRRRGSLALDTIDLCLVRPDLPPVR